MTVRSRVSTFSVRTHGTQGTIQTYTTNNNNNNINSTNSNKRATSVGRSTPGRIINRPQKTLSNLQQVKNAINHVCLAGGHYETQRNEAVRAVETCSVLTDQESVPISQFLVLFFHSKSLSFRGIYAVHPLDGKYVRSFVRA